MSISSLCFTRSAHSGVVLISAASPPFTAGTPRATAAILRRGAVLLRPCEENSAWTKHKRDSRRAGQSRAEGGVRNDETDVRKVRSRPDARTWPSRTGVGATARAGARRANGRGSIGEDVRRRLDETICGPLANAPSCPRAGGKCLRPLRDPRPEEKMPFAREKPVANSGVTDGRVPNGGDRPRHLASKASGLGSRASVRAGRGRHVLCVTRRTGATAENADIGRRLRGASGRLRGTRAWKTAR